jgi:hypothetical protein
MPVVGFFLISLCLLLSKNLSNVLLTWYVTPLSLAENINIPKNVLLISVGAIKLKRHYMELTEFKTVRSRTEQNSLAITDSFKQLVLRN